MKVIKSGTIKDSNWWVGREVTCDACQCKFSLEVGDKVKPIKGVAGVYFDCPECLYGLTTYIDGRTR